MIMIRLTQPSWSDVPTCHDELNNENIRVLFDLIEQRHNNEDAYNIVFTNNQSLFPCVGKASTKKPPSFTSSIVSSI